MIENKKGMTREFSWRADRTHVWQLEIEAVEVDKLVLEIEFRISGWAHVDYLAFGYLVEESKDYVHIKLPIPPNDEVFHEHLQPSSPLWMVDSSLSLQGCVSTTLKFFIKGNPEFSTATFEITKLLWRSVDVGQEVLESDSSAITSYTKPITKALELMVGGKSQIYDAELDSTNFLYWNLGQKVDAEKLFKFDGHDKHICFFRDSLLPLAEALLEAKKSNQNSIELIGELLLKSEPIWSSKVRLGSSQYWKNSHATSQRLIILSFAYGLLAEDKTQRSLVSKLLGSIRLHTQTIYSDAFYSRNNLTRVHNHGLFADVALTLGAKVLESDPEKDMWLVRANKRFKKNLSMLVNEQGDIALTTENSTHYYSVVSSLAEVGRDIGVFDGANGVIEKLQNFICLLSYSSGRRPAFGHSSSESLLMRRKGHGKWRPGVWHLPWAGFFIANLAWGRKRISFRSIFTTQSRTHKQDDTGSFVLELDGVEWFTDGGFYKYSQDHKSNYLNSRFAHNAVVAETIGNLGSTVQTDLICEKRWSEFSIRVQPSSSVSFQRRFLFDPQEETISVADSVKKRDSNERFYSILHFGSGVMVERKDTGLTLTHGESAYSLLVEGFELANIVTGMGNEIIDTSIIAPEPGVHDDTSSAIAEITGDKFLWCVSFDHNFKTGLLLGIQGEWHKAKKFLSMTRQQPEDKTSNDSKTGLNGFES